MAPVCPVRERLKCVMRSGGGTRRLFVYCVGCGMQYDGVDRDRDQSCLLSIYTYVNNGWESNLTVLYHTYMAVVEGLDAAKTKQ